MTHLYIEGEEVVLGEDLNIELHVFNPLLTSEGSATYDIDLDLRNQRNAKIYRHINRINSTGKIQDRRALLIVDDRVVADGKEILLNHTSNTVKIQIVAGNSEFNYDIAGTNMKDLDLGEIEPAEGEEYITADVALPTLDGCFPHHGYVCTPVMTTYRECPRSKCIAQEYAHATMPYTYWFRWRLNVGILNSIARHRYSADYFRYETDTQFAPQPYLLYYARKVFEAMGYKLEYSSLESDVNFIQFRRLFILNRNRTLKYNEMLPNWTVEKFVDELEKFFNVIFKVENTSKTMRIIHKPSFYASDEVEYIPDDMILDEYTQEFDKTNNYAASYDNVEYNFPDTDWYKYAAVDDDVITIKNHSSRAHTFEQVCDVALSFVDKSIRDEVFNRLCIYMTRGGDQMVISKDKKNHYYPRYINQMHGVVDEDSSNSTSLNIVPAEVLPFQVEYAYSIDNTIYGYGLSTAFTMLPYARTQTSPTSFVDDEDEEESEEENKKERIDGTTVEKGLNEYILNGKPNENIPEQMFVAFYTGIMNMEIVEELPVEKQYEPITDEKRAWVKYPLSQVFYRTATHQQGSDNHNHDILMSQTYDLSPANMKLLYYENGLNIDSATEFTISFKTDRVLDPIRIFLIHGRKFCCKELKYKIKADGLYPVCEGVFHAIKQ